MSGSAMAAEEEIPKTVQEMIVHCDTTPSTYDLYCSGMALGVLGTLFRAKMACIDKFTSNGQVREAFVNWA